MNDWIFIEKIGDGESSLDPHFDQVFNFVGKVVAMGNSLIIWLNKIIELDGRIKNKSSKGYFGKKIQALENGGYEKDLITDLRKFNRYLNLAKHTIVAANEQSISQPGKAIILLDFKTMKETQVTKGEIVEIETLFKELSVRLKNSVKRLQQ